MPVRPLLLATVAATAAVTLVPMTTASGDDGGRPLRTTLLGSNEVLTGDADGRGSALVRVNVGQGRICYELSVRGVDPIQAAHIHEAPAGAAGPVVVGLTAPTIPGPGGTATSAACASVSRELAKEMLKDPADYYVNVHNAAFPSGALRGQLG